jgi:hypothetical protein
MEIICLDVVMVAMVFSTTTTNDERKIKLYRIARKKPMRLKL